MRILAENRSEVEKLVEKPLEAMKSSVISKIDFVYPAVSSGPSAGAPLAGYRILAVPGGDYFAWVVRQGWAGKADIFYSDNYGGVGGFVSGIIKADIDKVALYEQSPTLKSMAEALKNNLFGYEFAMTFSVIKAVFDVVFGAIDYVRNNKEFAKANFGVAVVDGILFGVTFGIKEYMLGKVAEIIQSPAGTYPSKEAAIEAVKDMIYNKYFPFVNGPMSLVGTILMITVPIISIATHYFLIWRTYKKLVGKTVEKLKRA